MTTRQDLIRRALADADTFVSAQDLHAGLRSKGHRVGLATVYRALRGLAEAGLADRLRDKDGRHVYRICRNPGHHHYLRCQACGAAADVPASALDQWAAAVGSKYGFTDVTVTAELFGTCAGCSIAGQLHRARGLRVAMGYIPSSSQLMACCSRLQMPRKVTPVTSGHSKQL